MNSPEEEVSVAGLGVKAWGDVLLLHGTSTKPPQPPFVAGGEQKVSKL